MTRMIRRVDLETNRFPVGTAYREGLSEIRVELMCKDTGDWRELRKMKYSIGMEKPAISLCAATTLLGPPRLSNATRSLIRQTCSMFYLMLFTRNTCLRATLAAALFIARLPSSIASRQTDTQNLWTCVTREERRGFCLKAVSHPWINPGRETTPPPPPSLLTDLLFKRYYIANLDNLLQPRWNLSNAIRINPLAENSLSFPSRFPSTWSKLRGSLVAMVKVDRRMS